MYTAEKEKEIRIVIAHDYVRIHKGEGTKEAQEMTFGIRAMQKVIMPLFQNSDYITNPVHLKYEGDKENYTWHIEPIFYRDEKTNKMMVAVRMEGEPEYSHLTLAMYNTFIKGQDLYRDGEFVAKDKK